MLKKILLFIIFCSCVPVFASDYQGEKIIYDVLPVGRAEYNDLGLINLDGKKLNLSTFQTNVLGFYDLEKLYSDPDTLLPVKVERDILLWGMREYIIEEYDLEKYTVIFKNFKAKGKGTPKIEIRKSDGPIHNAILLPFYLRKLLNLEVGWTIDARFPDKFKIRLISIEEISVPGGNFRAYHFTSVPNKFEIWISVDNPRLPIKIKGMGGFGYTLVMREHSIN
ncbi:MAG: hypothetical protein AB1755_04290 [Candidatus Omnitrophota bacterium]